MMYYLFMTKTSTDANFGPKNYPVDDRMIAPTVKNGQVMVQPSDPNESVTCDRCGRTFPAKFVYCVCKG
jgi:hypothetical protein